MTLAKLARETPRRTARRPLPPDRNGSRANAKCWLPEDVSQGPLSVDTSYRHQGSTTRHIRLT
jgi:hypothetical protein